VPNWTAVKFHTFFASLLASNCPKTHHGASTEIAEEIDQEGVPEIGITLKIFDFRGL